MRSETTWYAFDETEFDNKEECEEYEKKILDMINSVMFFDYDMNHIKNPTIGDIESLAFYMVIKDAKKAKELFDYLPHSRLQDLVMKMETNSNLMKLLRNGSISTKNIEEFLIRLIVSMKLLKRFLIKLFITSQIKQPLV